MTNERTYIRLTDKFQELFHDRPNLLEEINTVLREEFVGTKDIIYQYKNFDELFDSVCEVTRLPKDKIIAKNRSTEVCAIRQFIAYKCKEIFGTRYSLLEIGNRLGGRDHTTVIHSIQSYKDRIEAKDGLILSILQIWQRYTEIKFAE